MQTHTHWIYDNFFPDAENMRAELETHFDENIGRNKPFDRRTIWNYWYIDKLYIYLRALTSHVFPGIMPAFMDQLQHFANTQYGLIIPTEPLISMYVNGCGQGLHNDAKNGRLAFVFSLTRWNERHFEGGETIIHKFNTDESVRFNAAAGTAFYNLVEPHFNRLLVFDDRAPHAVRFVQGTMHPLDARFVIHGHMEEPGNIAYVEGGLEAEDLIPQWLQMSRPVSEMLQANGQHGFITFEVLVDPAGMSKATVKHTQLLAMAGDAKDAQICVDSALETLAGIHWPKSDHYSKLVFALCSHPLRDKK